MADISIANLPAFLGTNAGATSLMPLVDVADTSESPLGTTKRLTIQQLFAVLPADAVVNGNLTVVGDIHGTNLVSSVPVGAQGGLVLETSARIRWMIQQDGTAETGGNAGSNLRIVSFDDAGGSLDIPISIVRAAGGPIQASRPTIIGPDPGGTEWLRVSNGARIVGATSVYGQLSATAKITAVSTVAGDYAAAFENLSPTGQGVVIQGGAAAPLLSLSVANYAGSVQFVVSDTRAQFSVPVVGTGLALTGAMTVVGPVVIGTDPGGTELLRVGGAVRFGAITVTGTMTASGFAANSPATASIALNTNGSQFTVANGAFLTLAANGSGCGLFFIAGPAAGMAALVSYHSGVVNIIWQTGQFTTVGGSSNSVNLYYSSGPTIQNFWGADILFRIINMAA